MSNDKTGQPPNVAAVAEQAWAEIAADVIEEVATGQPAEPRRPPRVRVHGAPPPDPATDIWHWDTIEHVNEIRRLQSRVAELEATTAATPPETPDPVETLADIVDGLRMAQNADRRRAQGRAALTALVARLDRATHDLAAVREGRAFEARDAALYVTASKVLDGRLGGDEDAVVEACRQYVAAEDALPDECDGEDFELSKAVAFLASALPYAKALDWDEARMAEQQAETDRRYQESVGSGASQRVPSWLVLHPCDDGEAFFAADPALDDLLVTPTDGDLRSWMSWRGHLLAKLTPSAPEGGPDEQVQRLMHVLGWAVAEQHQGAYHDVGQWLRLSLWSIEQGKRVPLPPVAFGSYELPSDPDHAVIAWSVDHNWDEPLVDGPSDAELLVYGIEMARRCYGHLKIVDMVLDHVLAVAKNPTGPEARASAYVPAAPCPRGVPPNTHPSPPHGPDAEADLEMVAADDAGAVREPHAWEREIRRDPQGEAEADLDDEHDAKVPSYRELAAELDGDDDEPLCSCAEPLDVDGECKGCHRRLQPMDEDERAVWSSWLAPVAPQESPAEPEQRPLGRLALRVREGCHGRKGHQAVLPGVTVADLYHLADAFLGYDPDPVMDGAIEPTKSSEGVGDGG